MQLDSDKVIAEIDKRWSDIRKLIVVAVKDAEDREIGLLDKIQKQILGGYRAPKTKVRATRATAKERGYRQWTNEQKLEIMLEANAAKQQGHGHMQKILSKYGISTAHLSTWRKQMQKPSETASS